jgi:hypothetical protein
MRATARSRGWPVGEIPTDDPAVVSILRARGFDTNGNPGMTIDLAELG